MPRFVSGFFVFALFLVLASPGFAQIPREFTNLQLLDPEIERGELVSIMKSWAGGLGVRCTHCHVGPDNLEGMDFATDEKPTKRTARQMLAMTRKLNREHLVDLASVQAEGREKAQVVSCYTCHRGLTTPPRDIRSELRSATAAGGVAAAIDRYEELVASHANAGRYDLRLDVLVKLSSNFLDWKEPEKARELLTHVLQIDPDLATGHAMVGRLELQSGNLDAAEKFARKALQLDPDDWIAKWVLEQVELATTAVPPDEP